ncbi:MAG: thiamine phosphate synthase [Candidatus Hydrogenedentota bacterium]|jgi:thiamine-phosphate pyrophosphorylase|nr:thiamine phosphate synthase [Candidatus Sumerlaea chitinivorans]RMH29750.1 MAG: thiamine phosphate synthase [Candidatus Hydrogenedentota bacterium]
MMFSAESLRLLLITDDSGRSPAELLRIVQAAIRGGVTGVQLREKQASGQRVRELVGELAALCQGAEVALFLNASLLHHISELPLSVGIHFGAATWHLRNSYVSGARDTLRSIGYSAHEIAEAQQVAQEGAHYVTLSPIYDTPSKRGILEPRGPAWLELARRSLGEFPIVALGGIDGTNAREVVRAGADGIAVIRAIMAAPDPEIAARQLREQVELGLRDRQNKLRQGT